MTVPYIHMWIDGVQQTNKQIVNATVVDDRVREGLNKAIDDQTRLTKTTVDNFFNFTSYALANVFPKVKND